MNTNYQYTSLRFYKNEEYLRLDFVPRVFRISINNNGKSYCQSGSHLSLEIKYSSNI